MATPYMIIKSMKCPGRRVAMAVTTAVVSVSMSAFVVIYNGVLIDFIINILIAIFANRGLDNCVATRNKH